MRPPDRAQLRVEPFAQQTAAFVEMFRVLRPSGPFCVSDIVVTGRLPEGVREAAGLYFGYIAGPLPFPLPDEALSPHRAARNWRHSALRAWNSKA